MFDFAVGTLRLFCVLVYWLSFAVRVVLLGDVFGVVLLFTLGV